MHQVGALLASLDYVRGNRARVQSGIGYRTFSNVNVHTPTTGTGGHVMNQYDVALFMQAHGTHKSFLTLPVMESDFSAQNIDGLLGRDVLAQFLLVYSGPDNAFMLSF